MAIIKANYTKSSQGAKASLRYIQHRPGADDTKIIRTLFGTDGYMERIEAYSIIDKAQKGSVFFRFVISPDPAIEDEKHDLNMRDVTTRTMQTLEDKLHKPLLWVASLHADHAPHRHVHVLAVVPTKLYAPDFERLRRGN